MWVSLGELTAFFSRLNFSLAGWDDEALTAELLLAEAAIKERTNREYDAKEWFESYDGNGRDVLVLDHFPLISLIQLSISGQTINGGITLDENRGMIFLTGGAVFPLGRRNIQVRYRAGFLTIPERIKRACLLLAAISIILGSPDDSDSAGIRSFRVLSYAVTYEGIYARHISEWRNMIEETIEYYRRNLI